MKKALFVVMFVLAVSTIGALAYAQESATGPQTAPATPPAHRVHPLVAALDANSDGVIDEQEINNASAALKTLDKNDDGKLVGKEYNPQPPAGAQKGPKGPKGGKKQKGSTDQTGTTEQPVRSRMPLLAALDPNGDHVIDAQEIANAPAALKTLDKNSDGKLTKDEYLGERPAAGKGKGGKGHKKAAPATAAPQASQEEGK